MPEQAGVQMTHVLACSVYNVGFPVWNASKKERNYI